MDIDPATTAETGSSGPEITVTAHGPYVLRGGQLPIVRRRIVRSEHGEPLVWQTTGGVDGGRQTSLCRCGGSANKPFCDGTHGKVGFAVNRRTVKKMVEHKPVEKLE